MLWLDRKYLTILGNRLEGFSWKSTDLANCRCFRCGDSKKKKSKRRGYFYVAGESFRYTCHNCHVSESFWDVLDSTDPALHREYMLEAYKDHGRRPRKFETLLMPTVVQTPVVDIDLPTIRELEDGHFAKMYIQNRGIPEKHFDILYFAKDFRTFVNSKLPGSGDKLRPSEPRVIIPFYDKSKSLLAFQGRSFGTGDDRYLTFKMHKDALKVFGLDRFNFNRPGFICEGPLDSLFIPNTLAVASGDLTAVENLVDKDDTTFICDNQPRNAEVVATMYKCLDHGFKVFMWPSKIKCKDINDLALQGLSEKDLVTMINTNSFSGLSARQKISMWKRV